MSNALNKPLWNSDTKKNLTWLEIRSSHTDSAIWMALALWVTEMAVNLNLSRPYTWFAWVTASLNTCSYLFWLRTAPMFTILGSQPPRTQEQEKNAANRSRRIVWTANKSAPVHRRFPLVLLEGRRVVLYTRESTKFTQTAAICAWSPGLAAHFSDGICSVHRDPCLHCSFALISPLRCELAD